MDGQEQFVAVDEIVSFLRKTAKGPDSLYIYIGGAEPFRKDWKFSRISWSRQGTWAYNFLERPSLFHNEQL